MLSFVKKIWPDAAAVVLFIIIGFVYFLSPVSDGLVLSGSDHTGAIGSGQELTQYHERTGEETRWTNALFSGMPTYQMSPSYGSRTTLDTMRSVYELGLPTVVMYVFILLVGFYILMRAMGYKPLLSVLGAIAWGLSSYFFIIIGAGHIWKLLTLAFIPPTIAGMVLCFKGKYLWGGAVLALFLSFQILSNHLQMTYYFLPVMALMWIAYLICALRNKTMGSFWKGTVTMLVAATIAICANLSNLYHTYEYSKETMRGRSELAAEGSSAQSGLTAEYITQWSYGIDETLTLLIPNAKGGASVPLSDSDIAMEKGQYSQYYNGISMYWGDQPGTSGPVYVGAIIMFLFILGLFVVKGPMKWALLVATILSILLSWGHNFMGFTQWFIDNVPLYNKFRTVSSILVIAEFTIPLLAIMALARVLQERADALGKHLWKFWTSLVLVGGAALLYALFPSLNEPFASQNELAQLGQYPDILADITAVRKAIFASDAWRTLIYVLLGAVLVWLYAKQKIKAVIAVAALAVLCLIDMYGVNKRYLNDSMFVLPEDIQNSFVKTEADEQILQDTSLSYRVLNFTTNTFNENETSYFHKSIGGYSAVKLGRYQDLIDRHIGPEMNAVIKAFNDSQDDLTTVKGDSLFPVLNMLNDKYFIVSAGEGRKFAVQNPFAMGNAWFVNTINYVATPNEEIAALATTDLRTQAVADQTFRSVLHHSGPAVVDSLAKVTLFSYQPNELEYEVESTTGGVVVFSEIYYPGWTATLDGQPLQLGRVNYVLRAAYVPSGKHVLHMEYKPASVTLTETIAYIAIVILLLIFIAAAVLTIRKTKNS
ncbi:MAG: YfhO family protein [Bacteroidaceae bacterium]|nr:YfhO family protein [Bacteroidaceae bacterium]